MRDGNLRIPGFGPMKIRRKGGNLYPDGRPVSAVLKRTGGRWHAIVCFAVEIEEPADNGHAIGLDRNAGQVADSDGEMHGMPDMDRLAAQGGRLQRKLSRQRKASRRRERTKRHHAKVMRKIANRRHDWHHHVSRKLAAKAGTVAVENLHVRAMTKSAKGTVEEPGVNVPQKSGLEPRHPEHRLDGAEDDAGMQGGGRRHGSGAVYVTNMPRVRSGRQTLAQNSGRLQLHGLRPCGPCRHQRGEERPGPRPWRRDGRRRGVRDWRICTARSVGIGHFSDP